MALTTQGRQFIAIVITFSTISTAFLIARLKLRYNGALGTDDYLLGVALLFLWTQAALSCVRMLTAHYTVVLFFFSLLFVYRSVPDQILRPSCF